MVYRLRTLPVFLLLMMGSVPGSLAQAVATQAGLKAAFVYQFPQFVDWPEQAWAGLERVQICVLRPNPFGSELERLVRGESLRGRALAVRELEPGEPIDACQVLFVSSRSSAATAALKAAAGRPILTVGDTEGFLDDGGIIALRIVDRRVRFEIDMAGAQRSGLRISSQLLGLARTVRGGPQ